MANKRKKLNYLKEFRLKRNKKDLIFNNISAYVLPKPINRFIIFEQKFDNSHSFSCKGIVLYIFDPGHENTF